MFDHHVPQSDVIEEHGFQGMADMMVVRGKNLVLLLPLGMRNVLNYSTGFERVDGWKCRFALRVRGVHVALGLHALRVRDW
jgi:hypothetical protein